MQRSVTRFERGAQGGPADRRQATLARWAPKALKSAHSPLPTNYGQEGKFMRSRDFSSWIWGDALSLLEHAERLHRNALRAGANDTPHWEPPIDIIETATAVLVYVA
jgi:hypothetical protein